jgi:membrane protease YdiL (CAAX protease family)
MEGPGGSRTRTPTLRWIWLAWVSLGITILGFVVFGMASRGDPTPLIERHFGSTAQFALLMYTIGQAVAALALVLLVKRCGLGLRDIGFSGRLTGRGALFAITGWFIAFWLYYLVQRLMGAAGIAMFWNEEGFFALDSVRRLVVVVIATLVIAPLAEEMIYRGYVLKALLARLRTPAAALLSALVFASIHVGIGFGLAVYIFLGALILAYLYIKFKNIYPCVLMHLLNNAVAYIVIPLMVSK